MLPAMFRRPLAPLADFLRSEAAGGTALIVAAIVALVVANSGAGDAYRAVLHQSVGPLPLHVWINDGLMAVFFLLVGLELRREMVRGELASLDRVAAPGLAALGGMLVPALIFVAFNFATPANLRGWAVPVATDIAFALAVLRLLGSRVPVGLIIFLTAVAIMDDLGAIVVIALFYTKGLSPWDLAGAAAVLAAIYGLNRAGVRVIWPYLVGGIALWLFVYRSGIHATLSGVALAFVVPQAGANAVAERLEHKLGSWVAFGVLPLFGLANAGLQFDTLPAHAAMNPLALGVALGLFVGKQAGVFGAVMLSIRLGLARRPDGVSTAQLYGGAVLCGLGFTMSLFINELAFRDSPQAEIVKLAVLAASLVSAIAALAILATARQPQSADR